MRWKSQRQKGERERRKDEEGSKQERSQSSRPMVQQAANNKSGGVHTNRKWKPVSSHWTAAKDCRVRSMMSASMQIRLLQYTGYLCCLADISSNCVLLPGLSGNGTKECVIRIRDRPSCLPETGVYRWLMISLSKVGPYIVCLRGIKHQWRHVQTEHTNFSIMKHSASTNSVLTLIFYKGIWSLMMVTFFDYVLRPILTEHVKGGFKFCFQFARCQHCTALNTYSIKSRPNFFFKDIGPTVKQIITLFKQYDWSVNIWSYIRNNPLESWEHTIAEEVSSSDRRHFYWSVIDGWRVGGLRVNK